MESKSARRSLLIVPAIVIVLVGIVGLIVLRATYPSTGGTTSGMVCKQRLTFVMAETGAALRSVIALSQEDAWAVGIENKHAMAMHWDGGAWKVVRLPAIPARASVLNAISAVNAHDIWAVGQADAHPLVLHWDGTTWSAVEVAPVDAVTSQLSALAVVAATDVWATGTAATDNSSVPGGTASIIAEHWDGQAWHRAPAPQGSAVNALSANSAGSVWGLITAPDKTTRLVHWDGQAWQGQLALDPSLPRLDPRTIMVSADNAVWVAGSYWPDDANWAIPLVERWDGASWSVMPTSGLESRGAWFTSIAAGTDGTIWVGGSLRNPNTRLGNALLVQTGSQSQNHALSLYPSRYDDPHRGDSFGISGVAPIPDSDGAWVIGAIGTTPDSSLPPIDSNLPTASGAFILSYC